MNDAIEASSSTTSTVWACDAATASVQDGVAVPERGEVDARPLDPDLVLATDRAEAEVGAAADLDRVVRIRRGVTLVSVRETVHEFESDPVACDRIDHPD